MSISSIGLARLDRQPLTLTRKEYDLLACWSPMPGTSCGATRCFPCLGVQQRSPHADARCAYSPRTRRSWPSIATSISKPFSGSATASSRTRTEGVLGADAHDCHGGVSFRVRGLRTPVHRVPRRYAVRPRSTFPRVERRELAAVRLGIRPRPQTRASGMDLEGAGGSPLGGHWRSSHRVIPMDAARCPMARKSISSGPAPYSAPERADAIRRRAKQHAEIGTWAAPFSSVGVRKRTRTRRAGAPAQSGSEMGGRGCSTTCPATAPSSVSCSTASSSARLRVALQPFPGELPEEPAQTRSRPVSADRTGAGRSGRARRGGWCGRPGARPGKRRAAASPPARSGPPPAPPAARRSVRKGTQPAARTRPRPDIPGRRQSSGRRRQTRRGECFRTSRRGSEGPPAR